MATELSEPTRTPSTAGGTDASQRLSAAASSPTGPPAAAIATTTAAQSTTAAAVAVPAAAGYRPATGTAGFSGLRTAFVVAVCFGAYHYSLSTLLHGLSLTTPLAYLGLVPLIALMLAVARALQSRDGIDIHDRYLDWIVGLPLLATALVIIAVVPAHLSTYFWLWRLDLLSLPLFVAGAIDLVFGARALWRLRVPVVFLGLASPAPYLLLANSQLRLFTDGTLAVLRQLTAALSLAQPLQIGDGSLFLVTHTGRDFVLSVNAASAGADSVLGFLLVGVAIAAVVAGPVMGRLGWLIAGAVLIWVLDLLRVLALFAAGRAWGEQFVLQPFAGLLALALGALLMMVVLPWFRLRVELFRSARPRPLGSQSARRPEAMFRRMLPALAVLLVAGVVAGIANDSLSRFQLITTPLGQPLLQPTAASDHPVAGWGVHRTQTYPWITAYLGKDATWERFQYTSGEDQPATSSSQRPSPITLDLFTTFDRSKLGTYGIEEAYHLNRYRLLESRRTDLGGGVVGYSVLYRSRLTAQTWTAVYWDWPVQTAHGVAYERVVLNHGKDSELKPPLSQRPAEPVAGLSPGAISLVGSAQGRMQKPDDSRTRDFLVGFSRRVVSATTGAQA
ncbi:MAG: exosortase/archaeosortase family protein [Candidatus Dormibacteraeota bacterium]|nr:exosortase/archaeosortase family protein [Candidatus Dormibacteraeota bacterium]